ncbi:hypothetical protein Deba_3055 [Desulfarculus baarsii DSM 2075]|uniref:Uncharacterized protein n=1 Tax=Desulfarculus baarsii (strain ATCC 33931 / DSM 2075 / LMG 7858 / VKM B-1802 / 2st14) TaxID=644282 RepID=E1QLH3_DESB2|nr:hypothetical protein [Desulfarculus baarsii]ADK86408.1 hypothetical protein Deba_3055 [Desulfarculus baarsii DSM 2075]
MTRLITPEELRCLFGLTPPSPELERRLADEEARRQATAIASAIRHLAAALGRLNREGSLEAVGRRHMEQYR